MKSYCRDSGFHSESNRFKKSLNMLCLNNPKQYHGVMVCAPEISNHILQKYLCCKVKTVAVLITLIRRAFKAVYVMPSAL